MVFVNFLYLVLVFIVNMYFVFLFGVILDIWWFGMFRNMLGGSDLVIILKFRFLVLGVYKLINSEKNISYCKYYIFKKMLKGVWL